MEKKIEDQYQKLEHEDHILKKPHMYIGSLENEERELFLPSDLYDLSGLTLKEEKINYNPAFINLFDEIITNASDHYIKTNENVKNIVIEVTEDTISVKNDGPAIPIKIHTKHNKYVPELIFGDLLSGENLDEKDERMVGGTHGLGAKIVNLFSKKFKVEIADGENKYEQTFYNNLSRRYKPKITKGKNTYTKITYKPDFERFGIEKIDDEIKKIFLKRAIDVSAYCPKAKIYFNGKKITVNNFKEYINAHINEEQEYFYNKVGENWEVGVTPLIGGNSQISIVNGVFTEEGGTHVEFIKKHLIKNVVSSLRNKYKSLDIKNSDIQNNICIFVKANIINPTFNSQTKEKLIKKINDEINITDNFVKKLINSDLFSDIIQKIENREAIKLKKQSKGKKSNLRIKKLDDANKAGTKYSQGCSLFITEGDSAKSFVLSGIDKKDKDYFGIYPLKGKLLNVRDVSMNKISENNEIKDLMNILGLEYGKKYKDKSSLRYDKLVITTDSDVDGTHIKGLIINFIDYFWPELLELDFIYEFVTPIVRATKNSSIRYFYKLDNYKKFKDSNESKGYFFKYYKGLGTIEPKESKKFFKNLNKHLIKIDDSENKDIIDLVFKNERANERKNWLINYDPNQEWDKFSQKTDINSFFNREFIEFSMYDNIRSIPSMIDGLKPAHRKILYTLFKKNFKNEIKVSQLSGAIIDLAAYHHGPQALEQSIIDLAQNFVGSNNINLLEPKGGFGTRVNGGKDAAASRYIFTQLKTTTRKLFRSNDEKLLDYVNEDGKIIEPHYYIPIIPLILVNGTKGIGTGYSTEVPAFNIRDIIRWYKNKLDGKQNRKKLIPYYEGFKGNIIQSEKEKTKFITYGNYEKDAKGNIKITELPIGVWNEKYFDHLHKLIEQKKIKKFVNNCTDSEIDILIIPNDGFKEKDLKLSSDDFKCSLRISNMHLFDKNNKLKKYENVEDILEEFYDIRYSYYEKRKKFLLESMEKDVDILNDKILFIDNIIKNNIELGNKNKQDILDELKQMNFKNTDLEFLLDMNFISMTSEKIKQLKENKQKIENQYQELKQTSIEKLWKDELNEIKL